MSRSETLTRLRAALQGRMSPELPEDLPALPRFEDPVAVFSERLTLAGGTVLDSRSQGLEECLSRVLREAAAEAIFWEEKETLENHSIPYTLINHSAFENRDLVLSSHPNQQITLPLLLATRELTLNQVEGVEVSAGSAEVGIAETGTILFRSGRRRSRLLFALPPCRLTLLSAGCIVHNLSEATDSGLRVEESALLTWATGPSRTADIEKRLVIGVHGPGTWFVILTD